MKIKITKERVIYSLVIIALVVLCLTSIKSCKNANKSTAEYENFIKAANDTLIKYRDKNGQLVARISVLESSSIDDLLKLETKDSVINKLKDEVERYKKKLKEGGSVTIIETITKFDTVTKYLVLNDTLIFDYSDEWVRFGGKGYCGDLEFHLQTHDEYTLAILGKRGKRYVELTNKNPYSDTKSMRTYMRSLDYKEKRWGVGLNVGPQIGYDFLHKGLYLGVGLSVGLNYNFITF